MSDPVDGTRSRILSAKRVHPSWSHGSEDTSGIYKSKRSTGTTEDKDFSLGEGTRNLQHQTKHGREVRGVLGSSRSRSRSPF